MKIWVRNQITPYFIKRNRGFFCLSAAKEVIKQGGEDVDCATKSSNFSDSQFKRRGMVRLIRLPLIFLIMFSLFAVGCVNVASSMKQHAASKPLSEAITCKENERLIIQLQAPRPVAAGMLNQAPYWISLGKVQPKDYSPEFQSVIDAFHMETDYQSMLLSNIEKNFNSRSSCPQIYITSADLKQVAFLPSDRVIQVGMVCMYHDLKPILTTSINWRLVANTANIPLIENKEQELKTMAEAFNASARPSISSAKQFIQKYNEIFSYYNAYGSIFYDSPAHSRDAWLEDNGKLVKQETDKALDELARQLAIALFPGEKGKEDGSTAQRSSSPTTTQLSPSPQPQESTESAGEGRGIINISTDPSGAKVFIDGEFKGQTPAEISLATGTYQIFLQRQLCEPYKESVSIERDQTKTLNIRLSPEGKEQK